MRRGVYIAAKRCGTVLAIQRILSFLVSSVMHLYSSFFFIHGIYSLIYLTLCPFTLASDSSAVTNMHSKSRILKKHFSTQAHTFNKAFIGIVSISLGSFMSLVVVSLTKPLTQENTLNTFKRGFPRSSEHLSGDSLTEPVHHKRNNTLMISHQAYFWVALVILDVRDRSA